MTFSPFPGVIQKQCWNYCLSPGDLILSFLSSWFSGFWRAWVRPICCPCFSEKGVIPLWRIPAMPWPILLMQHVLCVPPARSTALPTSERACDPAVKPTTCLEAFRHPQYKSMFQYLLRTKSAPEEAPQRYEAAASSSGRQHWDCWGRCNHSPLG